MFISWVEISFLTDSDAINPAIWPICKTTGCNLVVPLTRLETEIDFSATKKLGFFLEIIDPTGKEYEGIVRISYLINEKGFIEKAYPKVNTSTHGEDVLESIKE